MGEEFTQQGMSKKSSAAAGLCVAWFKDSTDGSMMGCLIFASVSVWVFPKIGVPPNHPFYLIGFSLINHPFWGTTIFGNTRMD